MREGKPGKPKPKGKAVISRKLTKAGPAVLHQPGKEKPATGDAGLKKRKRERAIKPNRKEWRKTPMNGGRGSRGEGKNLEKPEKTKRKKQGRSVGEMSRP